MSDTEPRRKRARSTSPVGGQASVEETSTASGPPTRDKDYYFPDGNCIMLVERTLFNVAYLCRRITFCTYACLRYIDQSFRETNRCSLSSSRFLKAIAQKVPLTVIPLYYQKTPPKSSTISFGRCMHCKVIRTLFGCVAVIIAF